MTPATASFRRGALTLALLHQLRDSDCIVSGLTVYKGRYHQSEHLVGGKAAPGGSSWDFLKFSVGAHPLLLCAERSVGRGGELLFRAIRNLALFWRVSPRRDVMGCSSPEPACIF